MLVRYLHGLIHLQLSKGAVRSLEYAMIVMVVAVAAVGAVNSTGPQAAPASASASAPASAPMQLASAK